MRCQFTDDTSSGDSSSLLSCNDRRRFSNLLPCYQNAKHNIEIKIAEEKLPKVDLYFVIPKHVHVERALCVCGEEIAEVGMRPIHLSPWFQAPFDKLEKE